MALFPGSADIVETISFNSAHHAAEERLGRYQSFFSTAADVIRAGAGFQADVTGWLLDRAALCRLFLNDVEHARDDARVAECGYNHFTLMIVFSGTLDVDSGAGYCRITPGEAVLIDMAQPVRFRAVAAQIATLAVAREFVVGAARDGDDLHGMQLSEGRVAFLRYYLSLLMERLGHLAGDMVPAVTRALEPLLSAALAGPAPGAMITTGADNAVGRSDRVRMMVNALVSDPGTTPAVIAQHSGLSRATLYRVFQSSGGVAAYIQQQRLKLLRTALLRPGEKRSFAQISTTVGFSSESHASRLFMKQFGVRPNELRKNASLPARRAVHSVYEGWMDDLRA